jgi:serine/threonine protein kinase
MQYPTILEYVKAIQDAGNNLDKLAHLTPVLDNHGEPYHISGAFAVVFKMQDKSTGKYYALKCFTKEQEGRADAYRQIAEELDMVEYPYIIFVKYMEKEVCVDCQCEEDKFPVLLMDWVDGDTMEAYIAANYHNQSSMSMLCYRFGKMAAWLRTQSFAHGDLKSDNIIVRPDGSLALVDYDGMFVPSMKGRKSPTKGTKKFSHPLRTVDDFDETIDDFSLASIALSLKAISLNSTLLDLYGKSDRLLFSEEDYRNPSKSKVISALQELMCNKDLCTLYSLFMLALARKDLSLCSYRLFVGEKPIQPQSIEDLSTKVTEEELKDAYIDDRGVKYSKDGRKLLKAPTTLSGTYSIKETTEIICDRAFFVCINLTSISVPNSVKDIGEWAFAGCSLLSSIDIPNSVISIGNNAFAGCLSLKYISIPESVICLNGNPFGDCECEIECLSANFIYEDDVLFNRDKSEIISFRNQEIESYIIPDSVTSIGDGAFGCCSSLSSLFIPNSVTSIGDGAFEGCSSLSSLVIPDSVVNIKGNPFYLWKGKLECLSASFIYEDNVLFNMDKSKLISYRNQEAKSFIIPNGVMSIEKYAFSGCSSLISISVPKSVTSIGDGAFDGCSSLSSIAISDSITSISAWTFDGCKSLRSLIIPDSVTCIGNEAFRGCSSLCSLVIPDSVTSIGDGAFDGCSSLRSLVIPDCVTSIRDGAFDGCSSLRSLIIPDSVTSIGDGAFSSCSSLRSLVIPDSVTSIGNGVFSSCSSLRSLVIPDSVVNIKGNPFCYWKGKLECLSASFIYEDNVLFNMDKSKLISFRNQEAKSFIIPDGVMSIGKCAFVDCYSLVSISIPNSVTSIGEESFIDCSSLRSLVIPDSVTSIGDGAFWGCSSLSSLVIPASVTSIGAWAFSGCKSLSSLVIPASVTSIGYSAFDGCSSLSSLVIPNSVTSIGDSAFSGCKSLSSLAIPDSVTSIGAWAFDGCSSLSSLVIPDGVTSIRDYVFRGCSSLSSLTIPDSVTSIGFDAFEGCSSLRDLVIPNSVNDIEDRAFEGCNFPDNLKQELISRFGNKIFG